MLPSLRTAIRHGAASIAANSRRTATRSFTNGGAFKRNGPSSGRVAVGATLAGVVVGTSYLTWRVTMGNQSVSLDASPDAPKKRKPKSPPQEPEASSSKATSEFLQQKEDEAVKEIEDTNSAGSSSAASGSQSEEVVNEEGSNANANSAAFNPETGEINWDCPCLGGMAYGPCGMEFREAFSCFVFSEEEPKGINCVEKFKAMQDCFRAHPETYGDEYSNDEEEEGEMPDADSSAPIVDGDVEPSSTKTPPPSQ